MFPAAWKMVVWSALICSQVRSWSCGRTGAGMLAIAAAGSTRQTAFSGAADHVLDECAPAAEGDEPLDRQFLEDLLVSQRGRLFTAVRTPFRLLCDLGDIVALSPFGEELVVAFVVSAVDQDHVGVRGEDLVEIAVDDGAVSRFVFGREGAAGGNDILPVAVDRLVPVLLDLLQEALGLEGCEGVGVVEPGVAVRVPGLQCFPEVDLAGFEEELLEDIAPHIVIPGECIPGLGREVGIADNIPGFGVEASQLLLEDVADAPEQFLALVVQLVSVGGDPLGQEVDGEGQGFPGGRDRVGAFGVGRAGGGGGAGRAALAARGIRVAGVQLGAELVVIERVARHEAAASGMELGGGLDLGDGDAGFAGLGYQIARHAGPGAGEDDEAVDRSPFLLTAVFAHAVDDARVAGLELGVEVRGVEIGFHDVERNVVLGCPFRCVAVGAVLVSARDDDEVWVVGMQSGEGSPDEFASGSLSGDDGDAGSLGAIEPFPGLHVVGEGDLWRPGWIGEGEGRFVGFARAPGVAGEVLVGDGGGIGEAVEGKGAVVEVAGFIRFLGEFGVADFRPVLGVDELAEVARHALDALVQAFRLGIEDIGEAP